MGTKHSGTLTAQIIKYFKWASLLDIHLRSLPHITINKFFLPKGLGLERSFPGSGETTIEGVPADGSIEKEAEKADGGI